MSLVNLGALSAPNWNVANAGPDRSFTITATNGSANVSSAGLFPASAVGFGGFLISLGGTEYTVSYVTSTSAAVLTTVFTGLTGSVACTWYKWLWMQIYSNQDFQPFGATYLVSKGTQGTSAYYKKYACSLVNSAGTNFLRHPQVTIDATTDSPTFPAGARYFFGLYLVDGRTLVQPFPMLSAAQVPPTTPTSLVDLGRYNQLPVQPQGSFPDFYSADEVDSRFPPLSAGQSYFARVTGTTMAPLTFGSGLSLDLLTGVLTAAGGTLPDRTITIAADILQGTDAVIFLDCTSNAITLNLPAASLVADKAFYVKKIDATANVGTIDPSGAETIDGAATLALSLQYQAYLIYSTGTTWRILADVSIATSPQVRTITTNTTILATDETVLINTASGSVTATLPTAVGRSGKFYTFKKITIDANLATVDPSGAELIDGAALYALALAQESITIRSNGTQWYKVAD